MSYKALFLLVILYLFDFIDIFVRWLCGWNRSLIVTLQGEG